MKQAQSIVLRYLENVPAQDTVNLETMAQDISRHWPFHGKDEQFFRSAVDALSEKGWVIVTGQEVGLNKIARVSASYLAGILRRRR